MKISFFEEFPVEDNIKKLNLINFPTKLFIAASNYRTFLEIKKGIPKNNVKEIIYWPVLRKRDGYWISPLANGKAIRKILSEVPKEQHVMLDLEIPIRWNRPDRLLII